MGSFTDPKACLKRIGKSSAGLADCQGACAPVTLGALSDYDLIFIGGGLAGGLAAYRCAQRCPDKRILLIERGTRLGGNHTWSMHASDADAAALEWMKPFFVGEWPSYSVRFPEFQREMEGRYFSISSERFHSVLEEALGVCVWLGTEVVSLSPRHVNAVGRGILRAPAIFDARGIGDGAFQFESRSMGFQKFLGQDLLLANPHGLTQPILMDACVDQDDGFRFFYVLPWGPKRVLIEDTRYSDSPYIDHVGWRAEIKKYADKMGWTIQEVEREEAAALPIPLSRRLPWEPRAAALGLRAGLFHPTTGYSLPDAIRSADLIADTLVQDRVVSAKRWSRYARRTVNQRWFYRFLNRMLFRAIAPASRYKIIERFYRLPKSVITRFYAGKSRPSDLLAFGWHGIPPVSLTRAARCLFEPKEIHA